MRWVPLEKLHALESLISSEIANGSRARQRDAIAVALGLHGLRVGEIVRAEAAHLFEAGRRLHVPKFKRGNPRDVALHESLVHSIVAWRGSAPPTNRLLFTRNGQPVHRTQLQRAGRRLVAEAIGEPLKFHALRHTFAMRCYDRTRDLFLVQRSLGHRSVKSTEVYATSLEEVPDSVLVKLDADGLTRSPGEHQLKLYQPGA